MACPEGETVREHRQHGGRFSWEEESLAKDDLTTPETLLHPPSAPLMNTAVDAVGTTVRELAGQFSKPECRAGFAACVVTTGLLARSRLPFLVVLGVSLVVGDIAEKAYARYLSDVDGD